MFSVEDPSILHGAGFDMTSSEQKGTSYVYINLSLLSLFWCLEINYLVLISKVFLWDNLSFSKYFILISLNLVK